MDRVIVDLTKAFEASQLYVARKPHHIRNQLRGQVLTTLIVSRARSLKGLKVVGLPSRNLGGANAQVKEFFEKYLDTKPSSSSSQRPQSSQASQGLQSSQV